MHGATLQDWLQVLHAEDFRQNVYIYDSVSHSVFYPDKELLPWDVALLLGRFDRKFRWSRGMCPHTRDVMKHVNEFCNKLQWQWMLRGSSGRTPFRVPRSPAFTLRPPACDEVAPEVRCWTSFFASRLRAACVRVLSRNSKRSCLWRSRLPVDNMAVQGLEQSPWSVVPTDTDGGDCLVTKQGLSFAHQETLKKNWYVPYQSNLVPGFENLAKEYRVLTQDVASAKGDASMTRLLQKSLAGGKQYLVRKLNVTVKSHKPAGQASFRNIHGGVFYPFAGLGAWLACPELTMNCNDMALSYYHTLPVIWERE